MAYDTLKAEIRQYIKTNGANEITGQILQNVLLDMVNAYPSLDGYATQQWVQNQRYVTESELSGYATQQWVSQQLGGYLPLTGGTLTGVVNFTNTYGSGSIFVDSIDYDLNITASNSIYLNAERGVGVNGKITANAFEKSDGTSSQFLKADGSVDSNTYITESALTDYATQSWVNTQLSGYLPLSGGTLTGDLTINSGEKLYFRIYGSVGDGYGSISVDGDGLFINATNTSGGNVYINPDVVVGHSLDVYTNLNVGSNAYIDNECHAASFIQTSDIRRKNIISDIGMDIGDIAKAPMFRFTMKDDDEAIVRVGTSAQYWQTVIPEVVSEDKRGVLGLQYDVIALASAITIAKTVVDHEARIAELEKENALLKAKLNIN